MKLSTAKTFSLGMLLAGLAIGVLGVLTQEEGTSAYLMTEVFTLVCLVVGVAVAAIWGKCPYCGKHLFFQMLKWDYCPKCRRALVKNPKKSKRK